MKKKYAFFVSLIIFLFFSNACKKECDFHQQFQGNFRFTVLTEHWGGLGNYTDTTYFDGAVHLYESGDEYLDENVENQSPDAVNQGKLMIHFLNQRYLLSAVSKDGILITESGYHYHHEGKFINANQVQFQITGLGGLGAGWNYNVTGERIQ